MRRWKKELLLLAAAMVAAGVYGYTHKFWAAEKFLNAEIPLGDPSGWADTFTVRLAAVISAVVACMGAALLLSLFFEPGVRCPQCGSRREASDRFCSECGKRLGHMEKDA